MVSVRYNRPYPYSADQIGTGLLDWVAGQGSVSRGPLEPDQEKTVGQGWLGLGWEGSRVNQEPGGVYMDMGHGRGVVRRRGCVSLFVSPSPGQWSLLCCSHGDRDGVLKRGEDVCAMCLRKLCVTPQCAGRRWCCMSLCCCASIAPINLRGAQ